MNQLFLHYGPGGHAEVEREVLGSMYPMTLFWDQPIIHDTSAPFSLMMKSVESQFESIYRDLKSPVKLWGHSFGCNLAVLLLLKFPEKIERLVLDSPVFDLPRGFLCLGKKLIKQSKDSLGLSQELEHLIHLFAEKNDLTIFWKLVETMIKFPDFNDMYWGNQAMKEKYQMISQNKKSFDFLMWKTVLVDYLQNSRNLLDREINGSEKVLIRIGQFDPYFELDVDVSLLRKKFSDSRIEIIPGAGHFTHLETLA